MRWWRKAFVVKGGERYDGNAGGCCVVAPGLGAYVVYLLWWRYRIHVEQNRARAGKRWSPNVDVFLPVALIS